MIKPGEKINGPFLFGDKGTPTEYSAGLALAIKRWWLELHKSGTFVFTQTGADPFAGASVPAFLPSLVLKA